MFLLSQQPRLVPKFSLEHDEIYASRSSRTLCNSAGFWQVLKAKFTAKSTTTRQAIHCSRHRSENAVLGKAAFLTSKTTSGDTGSISTSGQPTSALAPSQTSNAINGSSSSLELGARVGVGIGALCLSLASRLCLWTWRKRGRKYYVATPSGDVKPAKCESSTEEHPVSSRSAMTKWYRPRFLVALSPFMCFPTVSAMSFGLAPR